MIIEVKRYECKFVAMPLGRKPVTIQERAKGIKGEKLWSEGNVVHNELGELDGNEDSPTYARKVLVPGKTYTLDMYQLRKYGEAFKVVKEVDSYTIDDGESPEQGNQLSPQEIRERAEAKAKKNEKKKADSEKEAAKRKEAEAKAKEKDSKIPTFETKGKHEEKRNQRKIRK